jgi:hypothetical protein
VEILGKSKQILIAILVNLLSRQAASILSFAIHNIFILWRHFSVSPKDFLKFTAYLSVITGKITQTEFNLQKPTAAVG